MKISNKPIPVYCRELDKVFKSMHYAGLQLNISQSNIKKCLKGERKSAGGYTWEYAKGGIQDEVFGY